jgi:hypothetical protein
MSAPSIADTVPIEHDTTERIVRTVVFVAPPAALVFAVQQEDPHCSAPQQSGEPAGDGSGSAPRANRQDVRAAVAG